MSLSKRQLCDWLADAADPTTVRAVEEDLRDPERSVTLAWLRKMNATTERWQRLAESGAISRWVDMSNERADSSAPDQRGAGPAAADADSRWDVSGFVAREVERMLRGIENPSALLGREALRGFRDEIVQVARSANLLHAAADVLALHVALARKLRTVRRANARVTSQSGLGKDAKKNADALLVLLDAEDRLLADLQMDEEFAHVGLWYELAEDAMLSDEEIAELWEEDPAVVHAALTKERAVLQVALGHDPRR